MTHSPHPDFDPGRAAGAIQSKKRFHPSEISFSLFLSLSVQVKINPYVGIGCHWRTVLFGRYETPAVNRRYGGIIQSTVS